MNIKLPISKSIANRLLLLQAIHGDPLMRVSADMPDDVLVLRDALARLREYDKGDSQQRNAHSLTLHLKNCGTALRFLQVHLEHCYPGEPIILTGDPRLLERDGKPTSQTISARILHGEDVPFTPDESPYITMSRQVMNAYTAQRQVIIEYDWSAAAFWYEYIAIHGGELLLDGLTDQSLQGDRIVADIYSQYFGVDTRFVYQGATISKRRGHLFAEQDSSSPLQPASRQVVIDFARCPDLYPAIAFTCERLGLTLNATGTDRLRYKECDRLEAVRLHQTCHDHRMAMALLAADFTVDDTACIAKSYPDFLSQLLSLRQD